MKCSKCGAELQEGVLFCRECGAKAENVEKAKKFCRDCGTEIQEDDKFCPNCGANLSVADHTDEYSVNNGNFNDDISQKEVADIVTNDIPQEVKSGSNDFLPDKGKNEIIKFWNSLDIFFKAVTVLSVITVIMLLIALGKHNIFAIVFSVFQICGIVVASLMHKTIIKIEKNWIKYIVLAACVFLMILNYMSYSWERSVIDSISDITNNDTEEPVNAAIPIDGSECVDMDYSSVESAFRDAGFWNISLDEAEDLKYDEKDKVGHVISVSIDGGQKFKKGQEISADTEIVITYHSFTKCKVNIHINFISNLIFNKYDVEYDFGGYEYGTMTHGEDTDFEVSVEPGEYTLEFVSCDSYSVKGEEVLNVAGDTNASYNIYCYGDKISVDVDYVEQLGAVAENEIMMPAKASDYKYKNYQEVEKSLRELGFSNVSTKILYDIHFGITEKGETEKVSIDGNSDFNRGDIFSKDAKIVITYHMNEEDDPDKVKEDEKEDEKNEVDSYSVNYSTNDSSTVKNGNAGVYSYVMKGNSYDSYYIIDFDEGYVYWFMDGNGDDCDKVKIESGDLNDKVIITYHDGDDVWSYGLHFKYKEQPATLIMQDNDGFEYKFTTTDLSKALSKRDSKSIHEY